jgi:hypothetical protein
MISHFFESTPRKIDDSGIYPVHDVFYPPQN